RRPRRRARSRRRSGARRTRGDRDRRGPAPRRRPSVSSWPTPYRKGRPGRKAVCRVFATVCGRLTYSLPRTRQRARRQRPSLTAEAATHPSWPVASFTLYHRSSAVPLSPRNSTCAPCVALATTLNLTPAPSRRLALATFTCHILGAGG